MCLDPIANELADHQARSDGDVERLDRSASSDGHDRVALRADAATDPITFVPEHQNALGRERKPDGARGSIRLGTDDLHTALAKLFECLGQVCRSAERKVLRTSFCDAHCVFGQIRLGRARAEEHRVDPEKGCASKDCSDVIRIAYPVERDGCAAAVAE